MESLIRPFVLLRHELPAGAALASHWDLMIQSGDRLATWRLSTELTATPQQTVEQIGNHRLEYLGPIVVPSPPPRGRGHGEGAESTTNHPTDLDFPLSNNRGTVRQVARGEFHVQRWTDDDIAGELRSPAGLTAIHLSRTSDSSLWILDVHIV